MNLGKENETTEFKRSTGELKEGIISLASMLNKSGKGTLYFGVRNDGEVVGLPIGESTERDISEAVSNFIEPSIIPSITTRKTEDSKYYIEVKVEGTNTPYSAYGLYYARSADQDKKATRESLKKMFTSSGFDFIRECEATRQDLHFSQFISLMTAKGFHIDNEEIFIKNEHLLTNNRKFNQMAELLSDESDVSIKVVRFSGTDKTALSQRNEFGNKCLILAMQQVIDYIESINETNVTIVSSQRKETPLFDFSSFREAWINACLHNAWNDLVPPAIYLYYDRMEIVSYGGLPYRLSEKGFFKGESHPVNRALQTIFTQLNYTEQTRHGVPVVVKAYGKEAFDISENFITITLKYRFIPEWAKKNIWNDKILNQLNNTQLRVYQYLKENPKTTGSNLSKELKLSESSIKKITAELSKKGFMKRKGSKRDGYWSFDEEE